MDNIKVDNNENIIIGKPQLANSKIIFEETAHNNIVYCEDGVNLKNSSIRLKGANSIVFLSTSKRTLFFNATLYNDSVLYFGKNTFINGIGGNVMRIILSERKNLIIGADCLFSSGICFRTADAHPIYDVTTKKRINRSKSIYLGDHVWIGQDTYILKGSTLGSGSIIGACSVISGKTIHSNSVWAGNPIKMIRDNVMFTKNLVHNYDSELSAKRDKIETNKYIYEYEQDVTLDFYRIDEELSRMKNALERLKFLRMLSSCDGTKNRFFVWKDN